MQTRYLKLIFYISIAVTYTLCWYVIDVINESPSDYDKRPSMLLRYSLLTLLVFFANDTFDHFSINYQSYKGPAPF